MQILAIAVRANPWMSLGAFIACSTPVYATASRVSVYAPFAIGPTAIDHAIPLLPWTVYPYLTWFLLLPAVVVLGRSAPRFAEVFLTGLLCIVTNLTANVLVPTEVSPRTDPTLAAGTLLEVVLTNDGTLCALPSGHVSLPVALAVAAWFAGWRTWWVFGAWAAMLFATTLTTGQHYFPDPVAGAVWGAGVAVIGGGWIRRVLRQPRNALRAEVVAVDRVDSQLRDRMWAIFEQYYEGADRERFTADLLAKDHVFLLTHDGRLRGFSTVRVDRLEVGGRHVVSIFSGDTVIERAYHGQNALQWAFFTYIVSVKVRNPRHTVVWFLISKGYKTYLLLAKNFAEFYPRRDRPTPDWARSLIDTLATRQFPDAYDRESQTLHFDTNHERLRPDVAPTEGQTDPDVTFFVERNPGHARGDELCCIGVIDAELAWGYPLKVLRGTR